MQIESNTREHLYCENHSVKRSVLVSISYIRFSNPRRIFMEFLINSTNMHWTTINYRNTKSTRWKLRSYLRTELAIAFEGHHLVFHVNLLLHSDFGSSSTIGYTSQSDRCNSISRIWCIVTIGSFLRIGNRTLRIELASRLLAN